MNDKFTGLVVYGEGILSIEWNLREQIGEDIVMNGPYLPGVHIIRTYHPEECITYMKKAGFTILARIEYGGYVVERTYQETKYKGEIIHD